MSSWSPIAPFPEGALAAAAVLIIATACGPSPAPLPDLGLVPPFALTRETGAAFDSAAALTGKVWIADFIYTTCPGPCPRMTQHMKHLQDRLFPALDDRVRLVSFTVDPERDSPAVLAEYGARFKADPEHWYFLTGPAATLHRLSKDVFHLGGVAPDLEHSTRFVLTDKRGRIRGYYGTSEASDLVRLVEDAKRLVKEN